jgi:hypothetical protein
MPKALFAMTALLCVLIFAPFAPAQKSGDPNNDVVIQNLCAPDFDAEFNPESMLFTQDYEQLQKVRIELLERGYNPGFDSELDGASIAQLTEALRLFQAEYGLPATGQLDAATVAGLSIPIQKTDPAISGEPLLRAKPSR